MHACIDPLWHESPNQIARLVAIMLLLPFAVADREAMLIGATHLPIAVSQRPDQQGDHALNLDRLWG
jgi:hypothetical protein